MLTPAKPQAFCPLVSEPVVKIKCPQGYRATRETVWLVLGFWGHILGLGGDN